MTSELRLFVSASEPSGDALLAGTLAEVKARLAPGVKLRLAGLGGPLAEAQGLISLAPLDRLAVNGLGDVLRDLPYLWRATRLAEAALRGFAPHAVLLVDYPGLNLRLLALANALDLPVHYLAPPQLWARHAGWRREKKMRRLFAGKSVQVLFPFEAAVYQKIVGNSSLVAQGHGFAARPAPGMAAKAATAFAHPVNPGPVDLSPGRILLLCPGSRRPLWRRNLPAWLDALKRLAASPAGSSMPWHGLPIAILAPAGAREEVQALAAASGMACEVMGDKQAALARSGVALCFPGTMSLELSLAGWPYAVLALLDAWTFALGRFWVKTPHLALANILLGGRFWPEWAGKASGFHAGILRELGQEIKAMPGLSLDAPSDSPAQFPAHSPFVRPSDPPSDRALRLRETLGRGDGHAQAAERILRLAARDL